MSEEPEVGGIAQESAEPLAAPRKAGETPRQQIRKAKVATRRQFSAEEKIRIVMEGIRGEETVSAGLEAVHPRFLEQIGSLNITTQETARESNPIATALNSLFRAYRQALEADRNSTADHVVKSNKDAFLERYQIEFEEEDVIGGVLGRDLFVALRRVAKEFNLSFQMTSVQQFAQRFSNDLAAIREGGFEITINELRSRGRTYDIRRDAPREHIPS